MAESYSSADTVIDQQVSTSSTNPCLTIVTDSHVDHIQHSSPCAGSTYSQHTSVPRDTDIHHLSADLIDTSSLSTRIHQARATSMADPDPQALHQESTLAFGTHSMTDYDESSGARAQYLESLQDSSNYSNCNISN